MKADQALLEAALVGYQSQINQIQEAMAEIRQQLAGGKAASATPAASAKQAKPRRTLSAAARKRIAAAQKKRWAEYKKRQAAQ